MASEALQRANVRYRIRNREEIRARDRILYQKRREKVLAHKAKVRREKPDHARDKEFRLRYGITLKDYNEMSEQQEHMCAICKAHKSEFSKALSVDHCHQTGKVRGLLCQFCNSGLGYFKDNPSLLAVAIQYLEK